MKKISVEDVSEYNLSHLSEALNTSKPVLKERSGVQDEDLSFEQVVQVLATDPNGTVSYRDLSHVRSPRELAEVFQVSPEYIIEEYFDSGILVSVDTEIGLQEIKFAVEFMG